MIVVELPNFCREREREREASLQAQASLLTAHGSTTRETTTTNNKKDFKLKPFAEHKRKRKKMKLIKTRVKKS